MRAAKPKLAVAAMIACWAVSLAAAASPGAQQPSTGTANPASELADPVEETVQRGYEQLERHRGDDAIRTFKKADRLADGTSIPALVGLAMAYNQRGAYVNAEKTARRSLGIEAPAEQRVSAYNALGIALYYRAGDDDLERLGEAEAAFRSALVLAGGDQPLVKYNLGEVLLKLGQDDEGLDLLEEYLATDPTGPNAARARSLVDDPRRARENLVPDFSLVTLDGVYLTPDELDGKVVLFDFWGTWCPPCRAATPRLRRLAKRMQGEPFVLLGVINDRDRDAVEQFIEREKISWTQTWDDQGRQARDIFRVRSYPTYLLVDHQGKVLLRLTGWGDHVARALDREVARAVKKANRSGT